MIIRKDIFLSLLQGGDMRTNTYMKVQSLPVQTCKRNANKAFASAVGKLHISSLTPSLRFFCKELIIFLFLFDEFNGGFFLPEN